MESLVSIPQKSRAQQSDLLPVPQPLGIEGSCERDSAMTIGLGPAVAVADAITILGAGFLAYYLRGHLHSLVPIDMSHIPRLRLLAFLICYAVFTVLCNAAADLYAEAVLHTARVPKVRVLKSFLLSSLLTVMVVFLADEKAAPRLIFGGTMLLGLSGLIALRHTVQRYNRRRIEKGIGTQHVLIVGAGEIGEAFRRYLEDQRDLGIMFCGFIDDIRRSTPSWLGTVEDLPRIMKQHFIDEVYFTPEASRSLVLDVALQARKERIGVKVVPDLYDGLALGAGMTHIGNVPVLELNHQPIPAFEFFVKRFLDLLVAAALIVLAGPLMLMAALAVQLDSAGGVFYSGWRVGRKGRRFRCYKFRTMVADADARKVELRSTNERNGATFKISNDPRITPVGRFLRKYSIDELPQLFNVLRGDMSMVGPRPHPLDDFDHYELGDLRRLDVLPGITGLWQISARRDPSFRTNVLLDLEYIETWNIWLDIKILLRTILEVCRGSGH
jgi:exopolysaccharide biosynthesis polyprenyl glycosylphosphotransferase